MISVCCCAINARHEVSNFVEGLHYHNPNTDFEIVLTHDDRVPDNSHQYYKLLQTQFPNLTIVRHTEEDTIIYLEKLLRHYDKNKLFSKPFRKHLRENLEQYKAGTLIDPATSFLWLTSSVLYNKAVAHSKGDVIVISPADYIYLYKLKDLENLVRKRARNNLFYGKPNALRVIMSNIDPDVLRKVSSEKINFKRSLGRSLAFSAKFEDLNLVDFGNQDLLSVTDENFIEKASNLCYREQKRKKPKSLIPHYHGQHIMTKNTWNAIGGFSEEFYGRAWGDDKMSALGRRITGESPKLPPEFSFTHCRGYKTEEGNPSRKAEYLHKEFDKSYISNLPRIFDEVFSQGNQRGRVAPPVKILSRKETKGRE